MKALEKAIAEKLLQVKAVKLQPRNPFTWASGWKSPIYLIISCRQLTDTIVST